ncbi:MAG: FAD-dependent oxidoreductase [Phycisphaerae bacterium]|nr:FAD-dependent oxidoreductase [Phycisphaerae bacterium]
MSDTSYDVVIIGGGPAGLGAALYTSRDRFRTIILEKMIPGGQIFNTDRIENYPGIPRIDGPGLVEQMQKQVETFGTEIKTASEVTDIQRTPDGRLAVSCGKDRYFARAVVLAPGSSYRKLGVPGEEEFRNAGAGVSYCGTCDGPFFRDREVVAVGGGNTAIEEAMHLAKFASKVTLVHRRNEFRADRVLVEELLAKVAEPNRKMAIRYDTIVTAIQGQGRVQSVRLRNVKTSDEEDFPCDGVFIFVGTVPNTGFLKGIVELTDQGFIRCDCAHLRTSLPGVFVAGDCRVGATMQLVTAVADGVNAAMMIKQYFRDPKWWKKADAQTESSFEW